MSAEDMNHLNTKFQLCYSVIGRFKWDPVDTKLVDTKRVMMGKGRSKNLTKHIEYMWKEVVRADKNDDDSANHKWDYLHTFVVIDGKDYVVYGSYNTPTGDFVYKFQEYK